MKINLLAAFLFTLFLNCSTTLIQASSNNERKPYIVYMGEASAEMELTALHEQHHGLLEEATGDARTARLVKIRSYGRSINGFAARLLPHEVSRLSGKSNVVSVFPSKMRKLATTRSWDFLGMPQLLTSTDYKTQSNTIVGLLDTGIYVGAPSFSDKGLSPPPAKWKGKCDKGENFTGCNRKVIGARFYNLEDSAMSLTPTDTDGHGTHTASIVAGVTVIGASLYGVAKGTARGGVPGARIATYKVCGDIGCPDSNLLAGFDDAISDGVDVISISIGGSPEDLFKDVISIGSLHALKKGILTVCAAGNDGPDPGSVGNVAPWIFTVGATSMDRKFRTKVKLGNGLKFAGKSINTFSSKKKMYPLISSEKASDISRNPYVNASECDNDALMKSQVSGKIVLCLGNIASDAAIKSHNGVGTIVALDDMSVASSTLLVAATVVPAKVGTIIGNYINTTQSPQAIIYKSIGVNDTKAPQVAAFSSRGPQTIAKNIIKPDISAPGLDILAAYSKLVSITNDPDDNRHTNFNIISGTSMSCPHVSGAAAYVRSFHPDWSPAAIKSALMTTAKPVIGAGGIENPLNTGSGLLNPMRAVHPGLIYDIATKDYYRWLCKNGSNGTIISMISGHSTPHLNCSKYKQAPGYDGINYPSLNVHLNQEDTKLSLVFHRSVTLVGNAPANYTANVTAPIKGLSIKVRPDVLSFTSHHQKKSFKVVIKGEVSDRLLEIPSAYLEWVGGGHTVRSPILIYKPFV